MVMFRKRGVSYENLGLSYVLYSNEIKVLELVNCSNRRPVIFYI